MSNLTNFITTTNSTPRGLAYVAYGDPERYAQVKNQIRKEIFLGKAKLETFPPELIIDCISNKLTTLLENFSNQKYSFISEVDINYFAKRLYKKIIDEVDTISSYNSSLKIRISEFLSEAFNFISIEDSLLIIEDLLIYLNRKISDCNVPNEASQFLPILESEIFNDLTKLDSLPAEQLFQLKSSLDQNDFIPISQEISSYQNGNIV